ncbi:hypothetical protein [Carbonactinospora thermoautotrophica]|uniref:hypothetical protein n=1 Tax=Carbonactinospora thermoautotrophica TaxID=1469144 RepID=UPI003DA89946
MDDQPAAGDPGQEGVRLGPGEHGEAVFAELSEHRDQQVTGSRRGVGHPYRPELLGVLAGAGQARDQAGQFGGDRVDVEVRDVEPPPDGQQPFERLAAPPRGLDQFVDHRGEPSGVVRERLNLRQQERILRVRFRRPLLELGDRVLPEQFVVEVAQADQRRGRGHQVLRRHLRAEVAEQVKPQVSLDLAALRTTGFDEPVDDLARVEQRPAGVAADGRRETAVAAAPRGDHWAAHAGRPASPPMGAGKPRWRRRHVVTTGRRTPASSAISGMEMSSVPSGYVPATAHPLPAINEEPPGATTCPPAWFPIMVGMAGSRGNCVTDILGYQC